MAAPRPRVWPVLLTFAVVLPVVVVTATITVLAMVGLGPLLSDPEIIFSLPVLLVSITTTELTLVGAVLVAARPLTFTRLRLQRGRMSAGLLVAAVVGAIALSEVLETIVALTGLGRTGSLPMFTHALAGAHGAERVQALVVLALLAGFAEELFFRGFMQTRLAQRWSSRAAVLVAAICFGAMHFDLVHSPLALCLGIWLGFVCERADSLWPAMLAHVANNAMATLFAAARVPLLFGAGAVLVFVACAVWIARALPPAPPRFPPGTTVAPAGPPVVD